MTSHQAEPLSRLIAAADAVARETEADFGDLTAQQLNWKPGAEQWSAAQCFDHLVTANSAYLPIFDEVLRGEKKSTFWERLPWLPGVCGKLVIQAVSPENPRKRKAPKVFRPSSSLVDGAIILKFLDQQNQVIRRMRATEGRDLENIIITSPVARFIPYSLMDAYRILIAHEQRHLLQAIRVSKMEGFPKAAG